MTSSGPRSHAPVFWALFGAGGLLCALVGPMLVLITGVLGPFDLLLPPGFMSYARMLSFARSGAGEAFLFLVIALFAWHAAHRLYHSLHDVGLRAGPVAQALCYGVAMAITLAAAGLLVAVRP